MLEMPFDRLYADGTLVIDGQGAFISSKFRDDSRIKSIRVSEGVTDLGGTYSYAFWGCENLTTVSLTGKFGKYR